MDNGGKCMRNKYFYEMTPDEKIQFLAKELRRTQQYIREISEFITPLLEHSHSEGRIVTRLKSRQEESCGGYSFRVEEFKSKE